MKELYLEEDKRNTSERCCKKQKTTDTRDENAKQATLFQTVGLRRVMTRGTSLGLFSIVPDEVVFSVFDILPVQDVGSVAQSCRGFVTKVLLWLSNKTFLRKLEIHITGGNVREVAVALKRATCLIGTTQRICYLNHLLQQVHTLFDQNSSSSSTIFAAGNIYQIKGIILQTFVAGWAETEVSIAYEALRSSLGITYEIKRFFSESEQLQARNRVRALLLDHCRYEYLSAFWLGKILAGIKFYTEKANIILVLYSPADPDGGILDWEWISEEATRKSIKLYANYYAELARAISLLRRYCRLSVSRCNTLLQEIMDFPSSWSVSAEAIFMLHFFRLDSEAAIYYFKQQVSNKRLEPICAFTIAEMLPASQILVETVRESRTEVLIQSDANIFFDVVRAVANTLPASAKTTFMRRIWECVFNDAQVVLEIPLLMHPEGPAGRRLESFQEIMSIMRSWQDFLEIESSETL